MDPAELFTVLLARVLGTSDIDLETFFVRAEAMGMSREALEQTLVDDLENEGAIFGRFLAGLIGAAEGVALAAYRTGNIAVQISTRTEITFVDALLGLGEDEAGVRLDGSVSPVGNTSAIHAFNLEAMQRDQTEYYWVAELRNTCFRCLPLHGVKMRLVDWHARGLHPDTIHTGWNSICHCSFVREDLVSEEVLKSPLVRLQGAKLLGEGKGAQKFRHTIRTVLDSDIVKAQKAVLKARESEEGRRILRLSGQVAATQ